MTVSLIDLKARLLAHGDPHAAHSMQAYLRGRFPFLGIRRPQLKVLTKDWVVAAGDRQTWLDPALVKALWALPEREYHYLAVDLLSRYAKAAPPEALALYETCITTQSWWDTVDSLATNVVGPFFQRYPDQLTQADAWIEASNFWLQRTALLYQLKYRAGTDWPRLQRYILATADSPEFFLRKAIGWALRQYAKVAPAAVEGFVATHAGRLSPLSQKEALKHLR